MSWVIEFRNGRFLQSLEAANSGPVETAMRFETMYDVDSFCTENEWILFNGGMPIEVCSRCLKSLEWRGQSCCSKRKR